jgi:hypothetical protein
MAGCLLETLGLRKLALRLRRVCTFLTPLGSCYEDTNEEQQAPGVVREDAGGDLSDRNGEARTWPSRHARQYGQARSLVLGSMGVDQELQTTIPCGGFNPSL